MNNEIPAVVLGMFETGLGVARSLGRNGVRVYGFDHKRDIGRYSKYVSGRTCAHPWLDEKNFICDLINFARTQNVRPALFITADEFIPAISRNREQLAKQYRFNISSIQLLDSLSDKCRQVELAVAAGIPVPKTIAVQPSSGIEGKGDDLTYPVIIKAREVNDWRNNVSGTLKGFVVENHQALMQRLDTFRDGKVEVLVQEVIPGLDTDHYKVCCYFSERGKILASFTLRKIRQNPIRFGVGASVESVAIPELMALGKKLFNSTEFRGVGSAEFKRDERDGKFKLIEINPRYWQQNGLAEKCGINFPLIDYLSVTDQNPVAKTEFSSGIKWINVYMDFDSFLNYRKEHALSVLQWLLSLQGKKTYSDFALDDLLPGLFEIRFGMRLFRILPYLFKKIFGFNDVTKANSSRKMGSVHQPEEWLDLPSAKNPHLLQ